MSGHTPGPWKAYEKSATADTDHGYWHIDAGPGFRNDATREGFGLAGRIRPEDARLIASAPELLEALKETVRVHGSEMGPNHVARAAIAKAEGSA